MTTNRSKAPAHSVVPPQRWQSARSQWGYLNVAVANAVQKTTAGPPGRFEPLNIPLDPIARHAVGAKRGLSPAEFYRDVNVAAK
jgi:hypothetical protein